MGLSDWEILTGGGLDISDKYAVSGSRSLTQTFNGGMARIVHRQTWNDKPLNVRVDTWMTVDLPDDERYEYMIGILARVQEDKICHYYGRLEVTLYYDGEVSNVDVGWGYVYEVNQENVDTQDIYDKYTTDIGNYWNAGKWRFTRMELYQVGNEVTLKIMQTPDVDSPDPHNPPVDQLVELFETVMDVPSTLSNGGACGLIVGGTNLGATAGAKPYYDYTQIWY